MKPILLLFILACTGDYEEPPHLVLDDPAYTFDDGGPNNRYVLFYNCDPIPDFITFVVFDCAGNFVSRLMISPTLPCRGYDVVEVPIGATGRLEMVAWVRGPLGYVPSATKTENLGCP